MANKKQYGLMLPKKNQLCVPKTGNIFDNDDYSEEEEGTDWVKKALKIENEKNKIKKQTKLNMQKALEEDPTIFQYDEVYDKIERTKEEKFCKKIEQKAKYIDNLLKSADLRKKEQELRKDRMIQKEIEAEDAMFPNKERYVTSSYKAKLEEMKKFEEEQENKDRLEVIGDVTKQTDISGFYRHLYRQTVVKNDADLGSALKSIKPVPVENKNNDSHTKIQSDIDKCDTIALNSESEQSSKSDIENIKDKPNCSLIKIKEKRQYRKRAQEILESESDEESGKEKNDVFEEEKLEEIKPNTIEIKIKKQKLLDNVKKEMSEETNKSFKDNTVQENFNNSIGESAINNGLIKIKEKKLKLEEKKKVNIWEKRTVGEIFNASLQRYLTRKQERLTGF